MRKMIYVFGILSFLSFISNAQLGELRGTVKDSVNQTGIDFASVELFSGNVHTGMGTYTDSTGAFQIVAITPGKYIMKVSEINHAPKKYEVVITAGTFTKMNAELSTGNVMDQVVVLITDEPLMKEDSPTDIIITSKEIKHSPMAHANPAEMAASSDSNLKYDESTGAIYVRGSRGENTLYVVDGIKMTEGAHIPASAIHEVRVITSGIPAEFGDVTGGIIYITTKSYSPGG